MAEVILTDAGMRDLENKTRLAETLEALHEANAMLKAEQAKADPKTKVGIDATKDYVGRHIKGLQDIALYEAIEEANLLRTDHNGIMCVELFMGHDGHNVCRLRDYEKILAEGESGRDLREAVMRAAEQWKVANLLKVYEPIVIAEKASLDYNGPGPGLGVFSTADVQAFARRQLGFTPDAEPLIKHIESCPRIVRLKGGCHWLILPDEMERDMGPEKVSGGGAWAIPNPMLNPAERPFLDPLPKSSP